MNFIDTIILREPIFPFKNYDNIPKDEVGIMRFVKELFNEKIFKEGIYLASPELFYEWKKFCLTDTFPEKKISRLLRSIIKYYIRSTSNSTPFGLFSTYSILKPQNVKAFKNDTYTRYSSIDMSFLVALIKELNNNLFIKKKLTYFPNDTFYVVGDEIRYIETEADYENRNFKLSSLTADEVLKFVLEQTKSGLTINKLSKALFKAIDEIEKEEITLYIEDLIRSQILTSSLDICLNGISPFKQLIVFLDKNYKNDTNNYIKGILSMLKEMEEKINKIDGIGLGNSIQEYEEVIEKAKASNIAFNKKYLVNSDLKKTKSFKNGDLFTKDKESVLKAIEILSLFTPEETKNKYVPNFNINKFIEAFSKRYENREMPLLNVLDNVTGIGYIQDDNNFNSFSNVIDDLNFNVIGTPDSYKVTSNRRNDKFWFNLILNALKNNSSEINLKDEDLSSFPKKNKIFRGTFSILYSKIKNKISILSAGSSTAIHYIGRFTYNDFEMKNFANEIVEIEDHLFPDKILAEIIHLPANRAGNISARHIDRKHEISILSNTNEKAIKIDLNDILINVKKGEIVLRDKKSNKEIIPFLSCAQNYHRDTLPVYHFLCDLQSQYRSNLIDLNLNAIIFEYFNYIPRITYGDDIVLSIARWVLYFKDLKKMLQNNTKINVLDAFNHYIKTQNIPRYISMFENGREPIVLDLENPYMVSWFLDELEKKEKIIFTEVLHDDDNLDEFSNEYLMSFSGETLESKTNNLNFNEKKEKRRFIPCDEWIYFKIFTGINVADKILTEVIKYTIEALEDDEVIDKWFFIRYKDPDFHLRLRIHLNDISKKSKVIDLFNDNFKKFVDNDIIWKIELSTYERELERYYDKYIEESEMIFTYDSSMVVNLIQVLKENNEESWLWVYCLKSIDNYLNIFKYNLEEKCFLLKTMYDSISNEFNSNKRLKTQIDAKFRANSNMIDHIILKENTYSKIINTRNNQIKSIINDRLIHEERHIINDLMVSYIHMITNRFMSSNPGMHELVFYGILEKFYRKQIGVKKFKTPQAI